MSDNQSWNSSGSEEDIEPLEEPGHHVGIADLSGVLSKVSHLWQNGQSFLPTRRGRNLFPYLGHMRQSGVIYDRSKPAEYGRLHTQKLSSLVETLRNKRGEMLHVLCQIRLFYADFLNVLRWMKWNLMTCTSDVPLSVTAVVHDNIYTFFLSVGNSSNSLDYSRQSCYQAILDQLDTKGLNSTSSTFTMLLLGTNIPLHRYDNGSQILFVGLLQ